MLQCMWHGRMSCDNNWTPHPFESCFCPTNFFPLGFLGQCDKSNAPTIQQEEEEEGEEEEDNTPHIDT